MRKLYIKGLVSVADTVRRCMAGPLSAGRKSELRRLVAGSLAQVDAILADHGAAVVQLPAPTRRAYEFLSRLDLDRRAAVLTEIVASRPPETVTIKGLTSSWKTTLTQLAELPRDERIEELYQTIVTMSEDVHGGLASRHLQPRDLKAPSRRAYTWLRHFAARGNFDTYLSALRRVQPLFRDHVRKNRRLGEPVRIAFRPLAGIYRVSSNRHGVRVVLPTPMITFSERQFGELAAFIFASGSKQRVLEATSGRPYQALQAELDALGDNGEQTAGMQHDLAQSFDRVASVYFATGMDRPRLTWNRTMTQRKFGHYDWSTDTVMISCTLDDPDVPALVVDFVVYHELLHKKLGVRWRGDRQYAHTAQFRAEERRFERYAEAEAVLKRIARRGA